MLHLVSTPIGHPDDITSRALRTLREADVVVCEERREGARLLSRYGILGKPLETLNEHNEAAASLHIIELLGSGRNVAVVSDAGTPVFSDPGRMLVRSAADAGFRIVPVPGPSSLPPALTLSGFPIDRFVFCGFLPRKSHERKSELRNLKDETRTCVLMDTPYRLVPLIRDLAAVLGGKRRICVVFNLTLSGEAIYRGTAAELLDLFERRRLKGEFVVVVNGASG